jgi:hydrogenase nickel incorporation protein HypA/HybF
MHEMSIATALLAQTLSAVEANLSPLPTVPCVEEVEITVGLLQQVVPEALVMAWNAAAEGTLAAGARLRIIETQPEAKCRQCGAAFEPAVDDFLCPLCGQADVEIVAGNDIILSAVTCRDEDTLNEN